jgi:hypothetical protein
MLQLGRCLQVLLTTKYRWARLAGSIDSRPAKA